MEQNLPKVGDIPFAQVCQAVECQAVLTRAEGWESFAQVRVLREGAAVWQSPAVESHEDDWAFGSWCHGGGLPCLFADIDGDGSPEMLAPVPKADLAPTVFRVFRWDGEQLVLLRKSSLLRDDRGAFVWEEHDPEQDTQIAWVDYFEGDEAKIVHRRRATTSLRSLVLKPVANGFVEAG